MSEGWPPELETCERVDVLINNAGAPFDDYHKTRDGIEVTFATNHLGHSLLTGLLFDRLVRASAARVITVASIAHHGTGANGGWYLQRANYDRRIAYREVEARQRDVCLRAGRTAWRHATVERRGGYGI